MIFCDIIAENLFDSHHFAKENQTKNKNIGVEIMPKQNQKVKQDNRARSWSLIAYPESAPENFREILKKECRKGAISPLHDADLNADETQKKPHWHIYLNFEGKKSYLQVKAIADLIHATTPQKVNSTSGILRYFGHLDNPEKAQYDINNIEAWGGLNIEKEIFSQTEYSKILRAEIHTMILNENIIEYCDLLDRLFNSDMNEHYDYACNHTILFRAYLQSRRHKNESKSSK